MSLSEAPMSQWIIHCDSSTKKRCGFFEIHSLWNFDDEMIIAYICLGIPPMSSKILISSNLSMFFYCIVSQSWPFITILFFSTFTPFTIKARFNYTSYAANLSYLHFCYTFSNFKHFSENFMASNKRIHSSTHFTSSNVAIIMADSTI